MQKLLWKRRNFVKKSIYLFCIFDKKVQILNFKSKIGMFACVQMQLNFDLLFDFSLRAVLEEETGKYVNIKDQ